MMFISTADLNRTKTQLYSISAGRWEGWAEVGEKGRGRICGKERKTGGTRDEDEVGEMKMRLGR